jgi:hypothetical protein
MERAEEAGSAMTRRIIYIYLLTTSKIAAATRGFIIHTLAAWFHGMAHRTPGSRCCCRRRRLLTPRMICEPTQCFRTVFSWYLKPTQRLTPKTQQQLSHNNASSVKKF